MEGESPLGRGQLRQLWKVVDELVGGGPLFTMLRVALGAIVIAVSLRALYHDCQYRLRTTRKDLPHMNALVAIKHAEPGRGFYVGFPGVLLGIAVLPVW